MTSQERITWRTWSVKTER